MKKILFLALGFMLKSNVYAQVNIETKLDSIFAKHYVADSPGFSLGVVKDGELVHTYRRGLANLEHGIPIGEETVFRVASIAKQFTAACIGMLISDNKIILSDDVRKYIPELPDYGKTITIRNLLNHTSGIRNHNVLEQLRGVNYGFEGYTNKQVNELIFKQQGVNNTPGEKMLYSNSNYVLLALIVERVSGKSLNDFATQYIFQPLGMKHTFYKTSNTAVIKNNASAYYKDANGYQLANSLNLCVGAGGLHSTVSDLAKWSAIFTSAKPQYQALVDFLTTIDTLNDGSRSSYARGVFVTDYKGHSTLHHSGMDLGVRAQLIMVPRENLSLILLANLESIHAVNLSYQVLDLFIKPASQPGKAIKKYTHTSKELQKFTGDYQEINSDLTISILLENDTLKAKNRLARQAVPLVSRNKNIFERVSNASVTHTFNTHENQKWDMAADFGGASFYFERVKLIEPSSVTVADYSGEYYSAELGATYKLFTEENQLYASFPYNPKVKLTAGQKDEFGSGDRTRYTFKRDKKKQVTGFTIASEGTVKDILFEKANGVDRNSLTNPKE